MTREMMGTKECKERKDSRKPHKREEMSKDAKFLDNQRNKQIQYTLCCYPDLPLIITSFQSNRDVPLAVALSLTVTIVSHNTCHDREW